MFDNRIKKIVPRVLKDIQHSEGRINLSKHVLASFLFERLDNDKIKNLAENSNSLSNLVFIDKSFNHIEPRIDKIKVEYTDTSVQIIDEIPSTNNLSNLLTGNVSNIVSIESIESSPISKDTPFKRKTELINGNSREVSYFFQYSPDGLHSSILSKFNGRSLNFKGKNFKSHNFSILKSEFSRLKEVLNGSILEIKTVNSQNANVIKTFRPTMFEENAANPSISLNFESRYVDNYGFAAFADESGSRKSLTIFLRSFDANELHRIVRVSPEYINEGFEGVTLNPIVPSRGYDLTGTWKYFVGYDTGGDDPSPSNPVSNVTPMKIVQNFNTAKVDLGLWVDFTTDSPTKRAGLHPGSLAYFDNEIAGFSKNGVHSPYSNPYGDSAVRNYNYRDFDGVDDHVSLGQVSSSSHFFDSNKFTLSFWFYPEVQPNRFGGPPNGGTIISLDNGNIEITCKNSLKASPDDPDKVHLLVKLQYQSNHDSSVNTVTYDWSEMDLLTQTWHHVIISADISGGSGTNDARPEVFINTVDGRKVSDNFEVGTDKEFLHLSSDVSDSTKISGQHGNSNFYLSNGHCYIGASRDNSGNIIKCFRGKISELAWFRIATDSSSARALKGVYKARVGDDVGEIVRSLSRTIPVSATDIKTSSSIFGSTGTLNIEQTHDLDVKDSDGKVTQVKKPTPVRDLVTIVGSGASLVNSSQSIDSTFFHFPWSDLNESTFDNELDLRKIEIVDPYFNKVSFIFTDNNDQTTPVTDANARTNQVYVLVSSQINTPAQRAAAIENLVNKIEYNVNATESGTLNLFSDYKYHVVDGQNPVVRTAISHDNAGISIFSKTNSYTELNFNALTAAEYDGFTFILEDYEGSKYFYSMYVSDEPSASFYAECYNKILISNSSLATEGQSIANYANLPAHEKISASISSLITKAINSNNAEVRKATGKISVLSVDAWADNSSFVLNDGTNSVTFTRDTTTANAARVDATNYKFGFQNANSQTIIAKRIYDAILLAKTQGDLTITPSNPQNLPAELVPSNIASISHLSYINLTQDTPGPSGNTNITAQNNADAFYVNNFSGGGVYSGIKHEVDANTGTGLKLDIAYDGSSFSISQSSDSNPSGYTNGDILTFPKRVLGLYAKPFKITLSINNGTYSFGQIEFINKLKAYISPENHTVRIFDEVSYAGPGVGLQVEGLEFTGRVGNGINVGRKFEVKRNSFSNKQNFPITINYLNQSDNSVRTDVVFSNSPPSFSSRSRNIPLNGETFVEGSFDGTGYLAASSSLIGKICVRYKDTFDGEEFFKNLQKTIIENYDSTLAIPTFSESSIFNKKIGRSDTLYSFSLVDFSNRSFPEPGNSAYYIRDKIVSTNYENPDFSKDQYLYYYPAYKSKSAAESASSDSIAITARFLNYEKDLYFPNSSFTGSPIIEGSYSNIKDFDYSTFKSIKGYRIEETSVPINFNRFENKFDNFSLISNSSIGIENVGASKTIMLRIKTPLVGASPSSGSGVVFTVASSTRCRYYLLIEGGKFKFRAYPESSISGNSQTSTRFQAEFGNTVQADKWYTVFISFNETGFNTALDSHYAAIFDSDNHGGLLEKVSFANAGSDPTGNILENLNGEVKLSLGYGDKDQGTINKTESGETDSSKYSNNFTLAELNIFDTNISIEDASKISESHLKIRTKSGFQNDLPKSILKKLKSRPIFDRSTIFNEGILEEDLEISSQNLLYPELQPAGTTGSIKFKFDSIPLNNSAISLRLPDGNDFQVVVDTSTSKRNGFTTDERTSEIENLAGDRVPIHSSSTNPIKFGIQDLSNASIRDISLAFVKLINNSNRYLKRPVRAEIDTGINLGGGYHIKIEYLNSGTSEQKYPLEKLYLVESNFKITVANDDLSNKTGAITSYRAGEVSEDKIIKIDDSNADYSAKITCDINNLQAYIDAASITADYAINMNSSITSRHPNRIKEAIRIDLSDDPEAAPASYRDENVPLKPVLQFFINETKYSARLDVTRIASESNRYNICVKGVNSSDQLARAVVLSITDSINKDNLQINIPTISVGDSGLLDVVNLRPSGPEVYVGGVNFAGYGIRKVRRDESEQFNSNLSNLFIIQNFPTAFNPAAIREIKKIKVRKESKIAPFIDDDRVDTESSFFSRGSEARGSGIADVSYKTRTADKVRIEIDINPSTSTTLGLTTGSIGVSGQTEIKHGYETGTFNPMGYFNFSNKQWQSITSNSYTAKIETETNSGLPSNVNVSGNPGKVLSFYPLDDNVPTLHELSNLFNGTLDFTRGSVSGVNGTVVISQRGKDLSINKILIDTNNTAGVYKDKPNLILESSDNSSGFEVGDKIIVPVSAFHPYTAIFPGYHIQFVGHNFNTKNDTIEFARFASFTGQNNWPFNNYDIQVVKGTNNTRNGTDWELIYTLPYVTATFWERVFNHPYKSYSVNVIDLYRSRLNSTSDVKAAGFIEVLSVASSAIDAGSISITDPFGTPTTIKFTCDSTTHLHSEVDATNWKIGTNNLGSSGQQVANLADRIANAIMAARNKVGNNFDVRAFRDQNAQGQGTGLVVLEQNTAGPTGETAISAYNPNPPASSAVLEITSFKRLSVLPHSTLVNSSLCEMLEDFTIFSSPRSSDSPYDPLNRFENHAQASSTITATVSNNTKVMPKTGQHGSTGLGFIAPPGVEIELAAAVSNSSQIMQGSDKPVLSFEIEIRRDDYWKKETRPRKYIIRHAAGDDFGNRSSGDTRDVTIGDLIRVVNGGESPNDLFIAGDGVLTEFRKECRVVISNNDSPDYNTLYNPDSSSHLLKSITGPTTPFVFTPPMGGVLEFTVSGVNHPVARTTRSESIKSALEAYHRTTPIGFGGTYGFSIHRKDVSSQARLELSTKVAGNTVINNNFNYPNLPEIPVLEDEKYFKITSTSGNVARFYFLDEARMGTNSLSLDASSNRHTVDSYLGHHYLPQFIIYRKVPMGDTLISSYKGFIIRVKEEDRSGLLSDLTDPGSRPGALIEISDLDEDGFTTITITNDNNASVSANVRDPRHVTINGLGLAINENLQSYTLNSRKQWTLIDKSNGKIHDLFGIMAHGDSTLDGDDSETIASTSRFISDQISSRTIPYSSGNTTLRTLIKHIHTCIRWSNISDEVDLEIFPSIPNIHYHKTAVTDSESVTTTTGLTVIQKEPGVAGNTNLFNYFEHGRHFKIEIALSRSGANGAQTSLTLDHFRNALNYFSASMTSQGKWSNTEDVLYDNGGGGIKVMGANNHAIKAFFAASSLQDVPDRFKSFDIKPIPNTHPVGGTVLTSHYGKGLSTGEYYGTFSSDPEGVIRIGPRYAEAFDRRFTFSNAALGDKITLLNYYDNGAYGNPNTSELNARIYIKYMSQVGTNNNPGYFRSLKENFNKLTKNIAINPDGNYSTHFNGGVHDSDPNREAGSESRHFLELPMRARPVSNFGFPFSDTYSPLEGQKLNLSKYLDGPFLLEKFEIICSASIKDEVSEGFGRVLPESQRELPFSSLSHEKFTYHDIRYKPYYYSYPEWYTSGDPRRLLYKPDTSIYGESSRFHKTYTNDRLEDKTTDKTYRGVYDSNFRATSAQKLYDQYFFSAGAGKLEYSNDLFSITKDICQYDKSKMDKEFYFRTAGDAYKTPHMVNSNIRIPKEWYGDITVNNFQVKRVNSLDESPPAEFFSQTVFQRSVSTGIWRVYGSNINSSETGIGGDGGFSVGDVLYFSSEKALSAQAPYPDIEHRTAGFTLEVTGVTTTPDKTGVSGRITSVGNFKWLNASLTKGSAWWRCDTFFLLREKPASESSYSIDLPNNKNLDSKNVSLMIEEDRVSSSILQDSISIGHVPPPADKDDSFTYRTTVGGRNRRLDGLHYPIPSETAQPWNLLADNSSGINAFKATSFLQGDLPVGTPARVQSILPQMEVRNDSSSVCIVFYADYESDKATTIVKVPTLKKPFRDDPDSNPSRNTISGKWTGATIVAFDPFREEVRKVGTTVVSQNIDFVVYPDPTIPVYWDTSNSTYSAATAGGFFVGEIVALQISNNANSEPDDNQYSSGQRVANTNTCNILLRVKSVDSNGSAEELEFAGHYVNGADPTGNVPHYNLPYSFTYHDAFVGNTNNGVKQFNHSPNNVGKDSALYTYSNGITELSQDVTLIPKEFVLNFVFVNIARFRDFIDNKNTLSLSGLDMSNIPSTSNLKNDTFITDEQTTGFEENIGTIVSNTFNSTFAFQVALKNAIDLAVYNGYLGDSSDIKTELYDEEDSKLIIRKNLKAADNSLFGINDFRVVKLKQSIFPESTFELDGITTTYFSPQGALPFQLPGSGISNLDSRVVKNKPFVKDSSNITGSLYLDSTKIFNGQKLKNSKFFKVEDELSINSFTNQLQPASKGHTTRELISYSQVTYYGYAQSNSFQVYNTSGGSSGNARTLYASGAIKYDTTAPSDNRITPENVSHFYFVNSPGNISYFDSGNRKTQRHPHQEIFGSFESLSVSNRKNLLENGLGRELNIKIQSSHSDNVLFESTLITSSSLFEEAKEFKVSTPKFTFRGHPIYGISHKGYLTDYEIPLESIKSSNGISSIKFYDLNSFRNIYSPKRYFTNISTLRMDSSSTGSLDYIKREVTCRGQEEIKVTDNLYDGVLRVKGNCKNTDKIVSNTPYTLAVVDNYNNFMNDFLPEIVHVTIGSFYLGSSDTDGLGGSRGMFTSNGDTLNSESFKVFDLPKNISSAERGNLNLKASGNSYVEESEINPGTNFAKINPYLLNPEDNIILGFQTAVPGFESGESSFVNLGGGNTPPELDDFGNIQSTTWRQGFEDSHGFEKPGYSSSNLGAATVSSPGSALHTGRCIETTFSPYEGSKLVLYGSYQRNEKPARSTKSKNSYEAIAEVYGQDVFDQNDLASDGEFVGSRMAEIRSTTTIRTNPSRVKNTNNLLKISLEPELPENQMIFVWGDLTNSITGSSDQQNSGVKKLFASGSVDRYIFLHNAENNFIVDDDSVNHDMVYFDSLPPRMSEYVQQTKDGNSLLKVIPYAYAQEKGLHTFESNFNSVYGIRESRGTAMFLIGAADHTGGESPKTREGIPKTVHDNIYNTDWRATFIFEPKKDNNGRIISEPADRRELSYESNFGLDMDSFSSDGIYDVSAGLIAVQALPFSKQMLAIESNATNSAPNFLIPPTDGSGGHQGYSITNFSESGLIESVVIAEGTSSVAALLISGSYIDNNKAPITLTSFVNQVDNNKIKQTAAILFGFSRTPNRNLEVLTSENNFVQPDSLATDSNNLLPEGNQGFSYSNGTNSFKVAQQNPTQILAHPRGVKYGMMNYSALRPKVVFNRRHFGYFSDLIAGRPYAAFTRVAGSENTLVGFKLHEKHGATVPVEARFYDSVKNKLIDTNPVREFLFSQNLDRFQRSGVPFFDFDDAVDGGTGGRVRSSTDIKPEQISIFRADENLLDLEI